MPGGHLATSLALSAVAYVSTGSIEASAGCFAGGFLIDVDHYLDYLFFERQWRKPSPVQFLRYYFTYSPKKLVLPLHSAELMSLMFLIILVHPWPLLVGYWVGALMHLTFDVLVNGCSYAQQKNVRFDSAMNVISRSICATTKPRQRIKPNWDDVLQSSRTNSLTLSC